MPDGVAVACLLQEVGGLSGHALELQRLARGVMEASAKPAEDAGGAASGLLTVRVVAARSLKKMDMVGGADPFVLIKCGELEQKSKIIKKNRNPTWDASFEFPSPGTFATLEVQVYDWDRLGKNDSMGVVKLPVAEMDGVLKWHTLSPTPDCAEPEGEIQLQCSAELPVERPQNADEDVAPSSATPCDSSIAGPPAGFFFLFFFFFFFIAVVVAA